jgi:Protein of unknown function (DUF1573)
MSRLTILATLFLGVFGFIGIVVFITQDNRAAKRAALQANIDEKKGKVIDKKTNQPKIFPKAIAKVTTYEFGVRSNYSEFTHKFPISNEGEVPLTLKAETPSCPCLTVNLPKTEVAPGETIEIEIGAKPGGRSDNYLQGVEIHTNDPEHRLMRFSLIGKFQKILWTEPELIAFQDMLPNEERKLEVLLLSTWEHGFQFEDFKMLPAAVKFEVQDLPLEDCEKHSAKFGKRITFTCPKELVERDFLQGAFTFRSKQNQTDFDEKIGLQVMGNRLGKMSIVGKDLDELGRMQFGQILSDKGLSRNYHVKARGKNRLVEMKEIVVEPAILKVKLTPSADAATTGNHILSVEIPAGSPLVSHLGKNNGKIRLDFLDDEYKDINFQVTFAIIDETGLK